MLENKEQEKIAGIISDFFDGQVTEADIDILALKIYENAFKDPKWQKLKEWLKKYIEYQEALKVKNAKVIGAYMKGNIIDPIRILDKMQELSEEE